MSSWICSRKRCSGKVRLSWTRSGLRIRNSFHARAGASADTFRSDSAGVADRANSWHESSTRTKKSSVSLSTSATNRTLEADRRVESSPFSVRGFHNRCKA